MSLHASVILSTLVHATVFDYTIHWQIRLHTNRLKDQALRNVWAMDFEARA